MFQPLKSGHSAIQFIAAFILLLALAKAAVAQNVFAPRPEFSITPPALQQYQTNEMEVFSPSGTYAGRGQANQPFRWGPLNFRPHFLYRFLYGDGIQASTNQAVSTGINELSMGLLLELGTHWSVDYTPTWRIYSNQTGTNQLRDTTDHSVRLTGGTAYEDWGFSLSQSYVSSTQPLVETGSQTETETFSTDLGASYNLNSKMSLDFGINQNFISAQDFESSRDWSTMDWLNYHFWSRLDAAVGVGFGYTDVETGSDMTYEKLQGRVNWRATDKTSLQAHGGVEDRQFLGGEQSDVINPILGVSIQYQPFEMTQLSLKADRVVAQSYFEDQITETTSFGGNLNQRLFKQLYLDMGGQFGRVDYVASGNSASIDRTDDYYSFSVRLSHLFLKRGTFAVLYQYSDNSSSEPGFSYSSSQVGFEIGYRY
jgi:hypothetical protein